MKTQKGPIQILPKPAKEEQVETIQQEAQIDDLVMEAEEQAPKQEEGEG